MRQDAARHGARLLVFLVALAMALPAWSFTPRPLPGRLLVTLRDGVAFTAAAGKPGEIAVTGVRDLDRLNTAFRVHSVSALFPGETHQSKAIAGYDLTRYLIFDLDPGVDLEAARAAYAASPAVAVAEFDMMMPFDLEPNEIGQQWHLESTNGHDAHVTGGWNHSTGNPAVLLAIADSGVDWQHPDLGPNVWTNTLEVNGTPGVDDDANGFVDDVRGWDFVGSLSGAWPGEDASLQDNDPSDFNGHGTHVAGIAAAATDNGVGIAGVGWNCRILALRIGGSIDDNGTEQGVVLMSAAASALNYARVKGAAAFNCSWGSSNVAGLGAAASSAIAQGMVLCVAAGNDNNGSASYLSSRGDCIDVAATDQADVRASFSNSGPWVDVAAPGVNIFSTYFNHNAAGDARHTYVNLQGTSMAAPVVTGLVGLVKASNLALTGTQIRSLIAAGCDNIDALNPGYAGLLGAGRVNALRTFGDRHLTVPSDYPSFTKALAASGAGDTLAFRGGDVFNEPWFVNRNNRRVEGGWNAAFTVRDPVANPTIVQRSGTGPVLEFVPGTDATLVIDGFAFTGGVARDLATPVAGAFGGGVLCISASPILRNCRFEANTAGTAFVFGGGAGGFFASSNAVLENCSFVGNSAQSGSGLYAHGSTLTVNGGAILNNTTLGTQAGALGSGVYLNGGTLTLNGVEVSGNTGALEGGGFYVAGGSLDATAVVCANNAASTSGGHVRVAGGQATFRTSELRAGGANFGGGVALGAGTTLTLVSSVVAGNQANIVGGGVYAQSATASCTNVTWNGNQGTAGGGDAVFATGSPAAWTLRNCLVTGHSGAANAALTWSGGTAPLLDYNTFFANTAHVLGASMGANDRVEDPLYVDGAGFDFALAMHSPAIDSGDPAIQDADGTPSDRGAFGGPQNASRAPAPPQGLQVSRLTGPSRNVLAWTANAEGDLQVYVVYRGPSADFVPGAASFVATVPAGVLTYEDPAGAAGDWYRLAAVDQSDAASGFSLAVEAPTTTDTPPGIPQRFALHANEPNPFNPSTTLRFDLHAGAPVRLDILDPAGRLVRRLVQRWYDPGFHRVAWDGRDDAGRAVASGVYLSRLTAAGDVATRKMILVR
jgi:subtilisin family serine protease